MEARPVSALPSSEPYATALYEEHSGRIFGYCLRRLPSREEAEDAVQQTFMNAFRGLRQGVVPRSESAWLFKIAENVCRERRRSAWRRNRLELVQDPDDMAGLAAAPVRSHDELAGLADALAELPPNQQRAILLREWQGLSYKEIAEQLGLSEGAVETLLFRARRSLARKLDRSRGRSWSLGSLAAWGKSLGLGGAAKVAATAAVVASVAAATPAVRHALVPAGSKPRPRSHQPSTPSAPATQAGHRASAKPTANAAHPKTVSKGHVRGTVPRTRPERTMTPAPTSTPAPTTGTAPPPPATTTPPPAAPAPPALPPVSTPKTPALPVQVPPPPPLPTVTTPPLPTVQTPPLPTLP
jgi:RNA polymerase sigma-70 factor (ECF subfamily)